MPSHSGDVDAAATATTGRPRHLLETVLDHVPGLLSLLTREDTAAVASASWSTLLTVLRYQPATLVVDLHGDVLDVLSRAVSPPGADGDDYQGRLQCEGLVVPAQDAAALRAMGRAARAAGEEDYVAWLLRGQPSRQANRAFFALSQSAEDAALPRVLGVKLEAPWLRRALSESHQAQASALQERVAALLDRWEVRQHLQLFDISRCLPLSGTRLLDRELMAAQHLTVLDLSENRGLGDDELAYALPSLLRRVPTLRRLDLSGTRVTNKTVAGVADELEQGHELQCLKLRGLKLSRWYADDYDYYDYEEPYGLKSPLSRALKKNVKLAELHCGNCRLPSDEIIQALENNTNLRTLDLSDNQSFGAASAVRQMLSKNSTLQHLDLTRTCNGSTDAVTIAHALGHACSLRSINLTSCFFESPGAASIGAALAGNTSLLSLTLAENPLRARGVVALAKELAGNVTIRHVRLTGWKNVYDVDVHRAAATANPFLDGAPPPQTAEPDPTADDHEVQAAVYLERMVSGCRSLRSLDLSGCVAVDAAESDAAEDFHTTTTPVGDHGAMGIGAGLLNSTSLTSLALVGFGIGLLGCGALGMGLAGTSCLRKLDLSHNWLEDGGATAVAAGLQVNTSLEELALRSARIGDAGGCAVASALLRHPMLRRLDVSRNKLGDPAACRLAAVIRAPTSALRDLDASYNLFGALGGTEIARALTDSRSLRRLDLGSAFNAARGERDGSKVAAAFAEALQRCASLMSLDLSGCYVDDDGARALGAALASNSSLRFLNLEGSGTSPQGSRSLLEGVLNSTSQLDLKLARAAGKWRRHARGRDADGGARPLAPAWSSPRCRENAKRWEAGEVGIAWAEGEEGWKPPPPRKGRARREAGAGPSGQQSVPPGQEQAAGHQTPAPPPHPPAQQWPGSGLVVPGAGHPAMWSYMQQRPYMVPHFPVMAWGPPPSWRPVAYPRPFLAFRPYAWHAAMAQHTPSFPPGASTASGGKKNKKKKKKGNQGGGR
ncbi:unnamed protein product [Pedinophyceae sp. YPF-701]|nr:unnamed protein product [Pedinophyceae sp. YPF-701]